MPAPDYNPTVLATGRFLMRVDPSVAAEKVWLQLTGDDEGRVCRDIPEEACHAQPQNFLRHVVALAATRTGDGLADAKLVLAWLLGALGAPTFLVGFLVPVREAGALLPQLVTAGWIRRGGAGRGGTAGAVRGHVPAGGAAGCAPRGGPAGLRESLV